VRNRYYDANKFIRAHYDKHIMNANLRSAVNNFARMLMKLRLL